MSLAKKDLEQVHVALPGLVDQLKEGKLERREFLRLSTLLGLSATAAYALAGVPEPIAPAEAATGGTVTFSMRVAKIDNPAATDTDYCANIVRQVCDYLTRTTADNVTHPWLLERWKPSDDLKTWTLTLRKGIKWSNGDELTADHVVWNISRWLDEKTGSSILGLFSSFMMVSYDTGTKDSAGKAVMGNKIWSDSAIQKVDDYTIQLNGKQAMLALPESLFHYPALILHPKENGVFGVGSIGTGAFTLTEFELQKKAVLKRRDGYWRKPARLDQLVFIDNGDDPAAAIAALASGQVDGMYEASTLQYATLQKIPTVAIHQVTTAQTAVARMQQDKDPFKDPRVRKAMRLAVDSKKVLEISYLGLGAPGEHHHVAPIHPEYYKLPPMSQNIAEAKKLLADASVPNGFDCTIFCKKDPDWEAISVQAMVNMWKEIGVNVAMNVLPSSQYWDHWTTEAFAYTPWTHRPLGTMVLDLAYRTGVPWNESHYANPKLDALLDQADATVDVAKRKLVMKDIEELMQQEGPIVQPVWRAVFTGVNKRVKGFKMHPTLYLFAEEWSV
ncbi:MAG TPA: ABC transporter substrate-binding protein [Candidatus Udaeobacter sp.]|nr:ABC transporter substrate-binding protein [Candidatus Udaeobacter sp.]